MSAYVSPDVTIRPYPSKTVLAWKPSDYLQAVQSADGGNLVNASRFADAMLKDDRIGGVFDQRVEGMFSLPSVIEAQEGPAPQTIPEWAACFSEAEQKKWLTRALMLGFCFARRERKVIDGVLRWHIEAWPQEWFSWRDTERCWYVQARTLDNRSIYCPVRAVDGWLIYTPFGRYEPWRYGLWHRLAVPYLAKTFAIDDRSRDGEVTSILVALTKELSEPQRLKLLTDLEDLAERGATRVVMPEGCDLKALIRSDSTTAGIHDRIISWADQAITITIAGQIVTTEGTEGFSSGSVQRSILTSILRAQEESYSTALGEQVVTPLAREYGWTGPTLYQRWQIQDASDLNAQSFAIGQLAGSIKQLNEVLAVDGVRVDISALITRTGLPLVSLPPATQQTSAARGLALAPTDLARQITRNEARASVNLPALIMPDGSPDPRGFEFVITEPAPQPPMQQLTLSGARQAWGRAYSLLDEPAKEVTLFVWGENESDKGTVVLDREGANEILRRFGNRDTMFDLEHLSLERDSLNYDPDARGHGRLVADDIGLRVIDIKWTDDGDARIRGKRQRYTSPAFNVDKTNRVIDLVNVALTSLPATRFIEPLIAASQSHGATATPITANAVTEHRGKMTPEQLAQIAVVLGLGEDASVADIQAALGEAQAPSTPAGESLANDDSKPPAPAATPADEEMSLTLSRAKKAADEAEAIAKRARDRADADERDSLLRLNAAKLPGKMLKWAKTAPIDAVRDYVESAPDMTSEPLNPPGAQPVTLSRLHNDLCTRFKTDPERVKKILSRDKEVTA